VNRADEALLEAWCAGELRAFDLLYARFELPLFGFIHRQLGGAQADAEDVLHQVFLSVLEAGKAKRVYRVRPFLFQVARHACLNHVRGSRRGAAAMQSGCVDEVQAEAPDTLLAGKQTARALHQALARMPSALSEVYALRAAGLSYEEVAGVLQVPVGTVKSRLHELVSRLREELTP
jgi:RNA polymerase sigma-70 factor (ECF subfamily)